MTTKMHLPRVLCAILGSSLVLLALGCSRDVQLGDPALKPFQSMYAINRDQYGMTPLPREADVYIERRSDADARSIGYNVALHMCGKECKHFLFFGDGKDMRGVFFRLENGEYKWVGEQEICWGPREYDTVNGRFKEQVAISYFQNVQHQRNGLHISYDGPDHALSLQEIPIPRARQMLKDWGCT